MNDQAILELNRLLWGQRRLLPVASDSRVTMVDPGTYDPDTQVYKGAEAHIDGMLCRGSVYFTLPDVPAQYSNEAILHVVSRPANRICLDRGREVYQLVVTPPRDALDYYLRIRAGSDCTGDSLCGDYLAGLDPAARIHFFDNLFMDRSSRKYDELTALWEEGGRDWNYALYVALFTAMGGSQYKQVYTRLAKTVPYTAVAHEKGSREHVEALLLGGSGLLKLRGDDPYILRLREHFDHLCRKYDIMPMEPGDWDLRSMGSNRSPVLRLVQIAGFLCTREFIFEGVKSCRTPKDVYALFRAEIPEYWREQFSGSGRNVLAAGMGTEKMDLLGINLVVPLMFAYSVAVRDEELREAAQDLIERIDSESNVKIRVWRRRGVRMENACDSQAMLELNNEYCNKNRCYVCPVCRRLIGAFYHNKEQ